MTNLHETNSFKIDELAGEYSGVENRFVIVNKKSETGIYTESGFLLKMNYSDCKNMINKLQNTEDLANNSKATEALKDDLDNLYETIEQTLHDERFGAYPNLVEALQKALWILQDIDV